MTLDILQLAGGRDTVFSELRARDVPHKGWTPAFVDIATERAAEALHAELAGELTLERELFVCMTGERPGPGADVGAADEWDLAFETALLPVFEKFAARAGVQREWIVEALTGQLCDDAENLSEWAKLIAEHMVKYVLKKADSVNKKLSAIGIVQADIDAAFMTHEAMLFEGRAAESETPAAAAIEDEEFFDFMSVFEDAVDGPSAPVAEPPAPAPAPPAEPQRRRAHNKSKCYILPSRALQSLRKIGIGDKEPAAIIGVARTTWNRVAKGEAEEIGLTLDQGDKFVRYLTKLRAELDSIFEICRTHDLPVEGRAAQ